ncbi:MAG: hypothetical protein ACKO3P_18525 [Planctomycetaceae bacterium]
MLLKLPELMLARDDVGMVIWILFVLFSIVSWAVKTFGGKGEEAAPAKQPTERKEPARRREPRPKSVADEIRRFQEGQRGGGAPATAAGGRPATRPATGRPPANPPRTSQPTAESRVGRQLPSQGQGAKSEGRATSGGAESRRSPLANEKQRLDVLRPHEMGAGVSQHTQEFMRERLANQVSADLKSGVAASVSEHLGSRTVDPVIATGSGAGHPLARALREPENLRQALVLSLILGPPPARQPGRGTPPAGPPAGSA